MKYDRYIFQAGLCGTFALALHEYTKGKLRLGMVRGTREEDGEDVDVNVHAFCFMPGNDSVCLDSLTTQEILQVQNSWEETQIMNNVQDFFCDVEEFGTKKEFLEALKETGHVKIEKKDYDAALKLIKSDKKLQAILKKQKLI